LANVRMDLLYGTGNTNRRAAASSWTGDVTVTSLAGMSGETLPVNTEPSTSLVERSDMVERGVIEEELISDWMSSTSERVGSNNRTY